MKKTNHSRQTIISNITSNVDNKVISKLIKHSHKIKGWDAMKLFMCTHFINIDNLQCNGILNSIRDINFEYLE